MRLPNNTYITASKKGNINLSSELSDRARKANILPKLNSASLISLGQLCDDDCKVELTKRKLVATKNKKIVLEGHRNPFDGLWDIPVAKTIITANNYPSPITHGGLYRQKVNNINKMDRIKKRHNCRKLRTEQKMT